MGRGQTSPRLVDPGAMLASTHDLGDGLRVRLRLTRPTDAELVRSFLERLSPETRARRFLAPPPEVTAGMVQHFTFYDPRRRMMLAATCLIDGHEELIGLADLTFASTGLAEVGVVVADESQGRGIGRLLAEAVAATAIQRGATHLKAEMLPGNEPMLRLLERLGRTVRTVEDGHEVAYTRLRADRGRHAA